ncbi:hypothetical protein PGB90_001509 [Kerria lacca]
MASIHEAVRLQTFKLEGVKRWIEFFNEVYPVESNAANIEMFIKRSMEEATLISSLSVIFSSFETETKSGQFHKFKSEWRKIFSWLSISSAETNKGNTIYSICTEVTNHKLLVLKTSQYEKAKQAFSINGFYLWS